MVAEYDVITIGGGLAGAALAKVLAELVCASWCSSVRPLLEIGCVASRCIRGE